MMANLTVTIDDEVLRRARSRAIENGTSVNKLIRSYLESFAGRDRADRRTAILDNAARSTASSGPGGRSWTRDDLHDR